jgi:hypothetical protein
VVLPVPGAAQIRRREHRLHARAVAIAVVRVP